MKSQQDFHKTSYLIAYHYKHSDYIIEKNRMKWDNLADVQ